MADNFLITGYWGEPHVTAENDRGINAGIFGAGRYVLPVGKQFETEHLGNIIRMYDGKLMNNGAAAGIPAGEYVDLLVSNAGQGMKRNDLIVFQYSQDSSTLIESGTFVVVQGEETADTATDPTLTQEDLLSGTATFDQMALWRVCVSEATITAVEKVFTVYSTPLVEHTHKLNELSDTLNITKGGTGATTAEQARQNLGITLDSLGAAAASAAQSLFVPSDAWTGSEAPFTATVACSIATASNHLIVGHGGAMTADEQAAIAAAMIVCTAQSASSITLSAFGDKPTIAIPVNVLTVG